MSAPSGAASQAGEVPSLNDLLRYSDTTAFAVLSAATSRVLYLSPNAGAVLDIEPEAVTGYAPERSSTANPSDASLRPGACLRA